MHAPKVGDTFCHSTALHSIIYARNSSPLTFCRSWVGSTRYLKYRELPEECWLRVDTSKCCYINELVSVPVPALPKKVK